MTKKKRTPGQSRWIQRQTTDPYVQQAQRLGYASRAVFKLKEIQEKDRLIKSGMQVVDLGAAPGGWSKAASEWVGKAGHVYALDILPMGALDGVTFLQGDFTESSVCDALRQLIADAKIDLVICDMAPNMSGIRSVDQAKSLYLAELALDFCTDILKPGGSLLVKIFQGAGFEAFLADVRRHFEQLKLRKPPASRKASREQYLVARGFRFS